MDLEWTLGPDGVGRYQVSGGGSQPPGALSSADFLFTEEATPGTYTAALAVAAGAMIYDVWLYALGGPWAADTALIRIGDTTDPDAFLAVGTIDLVNAPRGGGPYDKAIGQISGAQASAEWSWGSYGEMSNNQQFYGTRYSAPDTVTLTITTTTASPPVVPVGVALVKVVYFAPVTAVAATFA